MGHPGHRRDGRLRRLARAAGLATAALVFLGPACLAADPNQAAARALEELAKHCRQHLPDLDLTRIPIADLLARAKSGEGSRDELRTELLQALKALSDGAKAEVLRKIKGIASDLAASPTEKGNYEYRRQLVLTFDKIERTAGRRPHYPRELGRPFVTLVERPSDRELEKLDGYLRYLSKVKPPKVGGGSFGVGGGSGDGDGEEEDPGGSTGGGGSLGPISSGGSGDSPDTPRSEEDDSQENRGWMLVRYYVMAVFGAIVFLYLVYVAYTAAKGGKSLLEGFRKLLRWRPAELPDDDPFQKGMKLFQRSKYREAIPVFEALTEEARISSQPARFYLLLSALKENKTGLVARHFEKLDREKFAPDEIYRLATALEASGDVARAKTLYRYLHDKDSSFRDVAQRLEDGSAE